MTTTVEKRLTVPSARGQGAPGKGGANDEQGPGKGPGRRKLVIVVLLVALLAAGAGYWFLLGPGASATSAEEVVETPPPVPGEVVVISPINLNLAGGHYLRIGLGLQMTADAGGHGDPNPSQALDLTIALFSGRTIEEVSGAETHEALKAELLAQLTEAYHGEVMDLYFTDYVTQ